MDSNSAIKTVLDATSIGVVAGTIMNYLPPLAALLTVIWTLIRIYETKTMQRWLENRKKVK